MLLSPFVAFAGILSPYGKIKHELSFAGEAIGSLFGLIPATINNALFAFVDGSSPGQLTLMPELGTFLPPIVPPSGGVSIYGPSTFGPSGGVGGDFI